MAVAVVLACLFYCVIRTSGIFFNIVEFYNIKQKYYFVKQFEIL